MSAAADLSSIVKIIIIIKALLWRHGSKALIQSKLKTIVKIIKVKIYINTVNPCYNAVVRRHLLGSRYKRGVL